MTTRRRRECGCLQDGTLVLVPCQDHYPRRPDGLVVPREAIVIGVGGVGAWVALGLAVAGVQTLVLVDDDMVDSSNMPRLPISVDFLGCAKTGAIVNTIRELWRGTQIVIYERRATGGLVRHLAAKYPDAVLIDCTDDPASQEVIANLWPGKRVRAGAEAWEAQATTSPPMLWGDVRPGYGVPSWVGSCMAAAACAIALACRQAGPDETIHVVLGGDSRGGA